MNKFRHAHRLGAALVTFVLAGCAAKGPDFETPHVTAPANWADMHAGAPELSTEPAAAVPSNWTQVNDPVLQALLAQADAANADVRIAALRFAQARGERAVTASGAAPQLGAKLAATRQRQSANGPGTRILDALGGPNRESLRDFLSAPFSVYDAGFDFSWELDLWGRVRRSIEAADSQVDMQRALLRQTRLTLRAEVARAYVELRTAAVQLRLAKEMVVSAESAMKLVDVRAQAGLSPPVDAVQQRGLVAEQRVRIPRLQQQEAAALNQLTLLCGERPGFLNAMLVPEAGALFDHSPPPLEIGVPSQLAWRRPDIQASLADLHAATASTGVAVADLYPRVRLGVATGFDSLTTGRFGEWGSRSWSVGPSLELPVFDGGRRRAVVRLRELKQQEAAVAFQHTVLKAWHEVDDAITDYNAERFSHADIVERLTSAQTALAVARHRYTSGLTSFAPVLDAQRTAFDAKAVYAQHQGRLWAGWFGVLKSLGVEVVQGPSSS